MTWRLAANGTRSVAVVLAYAASWLAGCLGVAMAQPIQWQHRHVGHEHTWRAELASDRAGGVYFATAGPNWFTTVFHYDAAGNVGWSRSLSTTCGNPLLCSSAFSDLVANDAAVYMLGHGGGGIKFCPAGCSWSHVFRLSPVDGSGGIVYTTPNRGVLHDLDAGAAPRAVAAGVQESGAGLLVVAGTSATATTVSTSLGRIAALSSGAVASTLDAVIRYDDSATVVWSAPLAGAAGCTQLIAGPGDRTACMAANGVRVLSSNGMPLFGPVGDGPKAIAFDGAGNLWVAGQRSCDSGRCLATLTKFGPTGVVLASDVLDVAGNSTEWRALSVAPNGDVYVTGTVRPLPAPMFMPSDMITARYLNTGARVWLATYAGAGQWNEIGDAIVATNDGAVVGATVHDTAQAEIAIIKYGAAVLVAPTLVVAADRNVVRPGETVTVTATIEGSSVPTGTVTFETSAGMLCASVALQPAGVNRATATCTFTPSIGATTISARYSGDGTFAAATAMLAMVVAADAAAVDVPALAPGALTLLALAVAGLARRALRARAIDR